MGADCCGKDDPIYQEINTEQQNDYNYNRYDDEYGVVQNQNDLQQQNQEIYDDYERKYDDLNQQYQAEIEQKLELTNKIQQLTNQVHESAELKASNIKLQQQITESSQYKETSIALRKENEKLIESTQKLENEIKKLNSRKDSSSNTEIVNLQSELDTLRIELDKMNSLKEKNNELTNMIDAMSEQQNTDKQMLKSLNEESKQSEQEIADYKSKLVALQKKFDEISKNAMNESKQYKEKIAKYEKYKTKFIALQEQNEELVSSKQKLENRIEKTSKLLSDLQKDSSSNTQIKILQSELDTLRVELDKMNSLKQQNNELSRMIDAMSEQQKTDKKMLKSLNEKCKQSEQEIADYKSKLTELQQEFDKKYEKAMDEMNEHKENNLKFEQQIAEYEEYKTKYKAEMAENENKLKEQITNLTNKINKYKQNENGSKFLDLQSQIESLEKDKAKFISLGATNKKLNETINELTIAKDAEIEKYKHKLIEFQKEVEQLEEKQTAKFKDMNAQILTLKAAQTMLQQKLEKEKNNTQQMVEEKERLQTLLDELKNGNDSKRDTGKMVKEWFRQTTPEPNEHQQNDTLILHDDQFSALPTRHRNYGVSLSDSKVFGVNPSELECTMIEDKDYGAAIPNVLIKLKQELFANNGHLMEGIFLKSPNKEECKQIEEKLDDGQMKHIIKWETIGGELIANLIKAWYKKLPNPVLNGTNIPKSNIASFVNNKVMQTQRALFLFLLDLCAEIIKYEHQNKMTIKEMAKACSPILYKSENITDPIKSMRISMTMLEFMECAIEWRMNESNGNFKEESNAMPLRKRNHGVSVTNDDEQKNESEENELNVENPPLRQTRRVALSLIDESKQFEEYDAEKYVDIEQTQMDQKDEEEENGSLQTRTRTSGISKSVNKKVFGVDPEQLSCTMIKDKDYDAAIPNILIKLKQELFANNGHLEEGIFRKAPNKEECTKIEQKLDDGQMEIIKWHKVSCHIIANLIKVWYRKLPNPILQNVNISKIENLKKSNNPNDAQSIINELTKSQKSLLLYLLDLCIEIIKNKDVNKMTAKNMAIVCAPNLYDPSNAVDPMKAMLLTSSYSKFVELAIEWRQLQHKDDDDEEKEEGNADDGMSHRSRHIGYAQKTGALVNFEEDNSDNDNDDETFDQNGSLDINNIYQGFGSGHATGNLSTMNGINGLNLQYDSPRPSVNGLDELQRLVSTENPNLSSPSDNDSDDLFNFTADDY